jgi:hypothetical protein
VSGEHYGAGPGLGSPRRGPTYVSHPLGRRACTPGMLYRASWTPRAGGASTTPYLVGHALSGITSRKTQTFVPETRGVQNYISAKDVECKPWPKRTRHRHCLVREPQGTSRTQTVRVRDPKSDSAKASAVVFPRERPPEGLSPKCRSRSSFLLPLYLSVIDGDVWDHPRTPSTILRHHPPVTGFCGHLTSRDIHC